MENGGAGLAAFSGVGGMEPGAWSLELGAGSLERVSWRWRRQTSDGQTSDFSGVASGDDFNNAAEPPPVKISFGGGCLVGAGDGTRNAKIVAGGLLSSILNSALLPLNSQFCT